MSESSLSRRATWELKNGSPALARTLFVRAATEASEVPDRCRLLERALDVCLEYLPVTAREVEETALALIDASDRKDARAFKALGMHYSLQAREAAAAKSMDASAKFEAARTALEHAITLLPEDADAHAALAGLHRRRADWVAEPQRTRHEDAALDGYSRGAKDGSSPYATLNAIEYGAVLRFKRAVPGAGGTRPDVQLFVGDEAQVSEQRACLSRALFVREQQFRRAEDRPWPAFDLARGRHYLRPNVPRLLQDIDVAIADTRSVARGSSDVWMLHSAAATLRQVTGVGVPIDGLDDALLMVQRAIYDDRWLGGGFGLSPEPHQYLVAELAEVRAVLDNLLNASSNSGHSDELLRAYVAESRKRWTVDDEETFQKEVPIFLRAIESKEKKLARALWKLGGKAAATIGLEAIVPGATAAKVVAAVVENLVERQLASPSAL